MSAIAQIENALICRVAGETIRIEPWGEDSLRVRSWMGAGPYSESGIENGPLSALLPPQATHAEFKLGDSQATLSNGAISVEVLYEVDNIHGVPAISMRFFNTNTGQELLTEAPAYFPRPPARKFRAVGGNHYHLAVRFAAREGERFYGLGQHQHDLFDQKGVVIDLQQINTEVCIPFLYSNIGYGFLWNNPALGRVELGQDVTRWVAESTQQMDYWITAGDTPAEVMAHYAEATGHAPNLPKWAAGFWQCKLRYRTQDELLSIARGYKERGLPIDVIVIDFFHWTMQGDWQFDPECWPDPAAMMRELDELGIKVMVSIWPSVNPNSRNFAEMDAKGYLVQTKRGTSALLPFVDTEPPGRVYVHYYDATNPDARRFVWEKVRAGYYDYGIKTWWLDACEPEILPADSDNLQFWLGDGAAVCNIYPLLHERGFYEGMRAEGEEEFVSLCRSGWAGSQRYAAALWSGDIRSTFESLRAQVRAGLNMAMSGIPWWTTDIGGFFDGDIRTDSFRELLVRWFQYGVFCPLFRLHGYRCPIDEGDMFNGADNEVWSFGEETYEILRRYMFLRERLRPYVMEQMRAASKNGAPPMRPLFFEFPNDKACWTVDDQFMLGPDLLVVPVIEAGATSRSVYLPQGVEWTDAWTGAKVDGGKIIEASAPIERIPLYLRDGANLPITEE